MSHEYSIFSSLYPLSGQAELYIKAGIFENNCLDNYSFLDKHFYLNRKKNVWGLHTIYLFYDSGIFENNC